jgi:uncharacterized alkaline shock family protein YloU
MPGQASISADILARYAGDAACEVDGVHGLCESPLPGRRGVRVASDGGGVRLELHLAVDWAASIPEVGREVQARVREYLLRMADVEPASVDVVVDEVGPLP